MNKTQIYLPGLNGIRAIAALIVMVFHIDQFSRFFDIPSIGFHKSGMAGYGVVLFFTLSGFLITYLLLTEKQEFNRIDFYRFYMRRVLRIWPLYYAMILITLLIFIFYPEWINVHGDATISFIFYSCLLPNIGYAFGYGITTMTPLWSVGVEEQFYAFWPSVINNSKSILKALIVVLSICLFIKISFRIFENDTLYRIIGSINFGCMAIGGIGAFMVYSNSKSLKVIYHPILQMIAWAVLILSILYKPIHIFSVIDTETHSFFYVIIIMNVSSNNKTIISLENKLLSFIGRISYGIYVYHMTVIVLLSVFIKHVLHYSFTGTWEKYFVLYAIVISVTLALSYLSYQYFESFFLRLKTKYAKIESFNKKIE